MNTEQETKIAELNKQRQDRLDFVEAQYNTPTIQQYRDNERYAWAVKTINEKFNAQIEEIKSNHEN